jgi:nicotinamide riboside kinase
MELTRPQKGASTFKKIAFVGAHGTGKTTLVNALRDYLQSMGVECAITPELPRIICDTASDPTFFRRGNNSLLRQTLLLAGQPIYETAEASDEGVLLCDRSILDHWAYTLNLFLPELQIEGVIPPLQDLVARHCCSYDYIFYVPIEFAPQDDGIRESDQEFQSAIDKEITRLLNVYALTYHKVSGTITERLNQTLRVLEFN